MIARKVRRRMKERAASSTISSSRRWYGALPRSARQAMSHQRSAKVGRRVLTLDEAKAETTPPRQLLRQSPPLLSFVGGNRSGSSANDPCDIFKSALCEVEAHNHAGPDRHIALERWRCAQTKDRVPEHAFAVEQKRN